MRLGLCLVAASFVSIGFFMYGAWRNQSLLYEYLVWNLFLAWLPLVFAVWLIKLLPSRPWTSWLPVLVTLLWLGFLPNSFYLISDYIHLQEIQRVDILYDVVMFSSFVFNGLIVGYVSLLLVHRELRRRLSHDRAGLIVAAIIFVCSYAIFLGRDLRWNTWDVLLNPAGILFDVSDRFIRFGQDPQMALTTLSFFVLLGSMYVVIWQGLLAIRALKS